MTPSLPGSFRHCKSNVYRMKIPDDAIIAPEKLTDYLLAWRPVDDKSEFLEQAGFTRQPEPLLDSIRQIAIFSEAWEDGSNDYGKFFRMEGILHGPNGKDLRVFLIWIQWHLDGTFHFVTLKPWKGPSREI